ncbi:MAG: class I SAM-dependent methyltransferase [Gemmatimonadales bacterium]
MSFTDLFSEKSATYAQARPTYPDALYRFVAGVAPAKERAWDCATGNGQAAIGLARHFGAVEATDASAQQVANAIAAPGVRFSVQPAERTDFAPASFDAVCIAQALHWFDLDRFWPEVRRVVRPGGLVVAWCYGPTRLPDPALNTVVYSLYDAVLGEWWPANRRHIDASYTTINFPFPRLLSPALEMRVSWTLPQLLGYVRTWSAAQRYQAATGLDPFPEFVAQLAPLWGEGMHEVEWPLTILAGRNDAAHG